MTRFDNISKEGIEAYNRITEKIENNEKEKQKYLEYKNKLTSIDFSLIANYFDNFSEMVKNQIGSSILYDYLGNEFAKIKNGLTLKNRNKKRYLIKK